ncbi:hypothetical protein [Caulobacter sp. LARHSG274]
MGALQFLPEGLEPAAIAPQRALALTPPGFHEEIHASIKTAIDPRLLRLRPALET